MEVIQYDKHQQTCDLCLMQCTKQLNKFVEKKWQRFSVTKEHTT